MKRHLPSVRLLVTTALVASSVSLVTAISRPAVIAIDGLRLPSDVAPVTAGGTAYLPVRAVTEATGARTTYDAARGEVVVRRGNDVLVVRVGQRRATLDGAPIELSHAPFTVHGRTLMPGADLARALGSIVKYDPLRGRIDVRTPGAVVAGATEN